MEEKVDTRVLVLGDARGFMVTATINALEKEGLDVTCVPQTVDAIAELKDAPTLWIFYMEDLTEDVVKALIYCRDVIGEKGIYFYLIGNPEDFKEVYKIVPEPTVTKAFERPVNNKDLVAELRLAIEKGKNAAEEKKILIVDDDPTLARMVKNLLEDKYQVYMASSGMNAITLLAKTKIDLILLDYEMPVVSGDKVLEMIRSEEQTKDIPVIMLTAKSDKESVMKVLALKPEKYLLKSMPPDRWLTEIDDYFRMNN